MFNYLIFDIIGAFFMALAIVLLLGKPFIALLKSRKSLAQPIRDDGPSTHHSKKGTPSLGGVLIMLAFVVSSVFWAKLNLIVIVILITSVSFAIIGLCDDVLKLLKQDSKGLKGKMRMLIGFIIAGIATYVLHVVQPESMAHYLYLPFDVPFVNIMQNTNYIYISAIGVILLGAFVVVASANSMNLTDGLDGMASKVAIVIFITLLILLFIISVNISSDAEIYYDNASQISIVIAAMLGALFGFLFYNRYPAKIFMGDMGSLGIGSAIGIIVVALKHELFLVLAGLVLVIESLSVIIQVYYYKLTKKRFFLMAPLHHHFEKKGYHESKVVRMFVIFTIVCCSISLILVNS